MKPDVPTRVLRAAGEWEHLSGRDRSALARELRCSGWSYGEIMDLIPVAKGTLAYWCRDLTLSPTQAAAIKRRRPPGVITGRPIDTQRKRRAEIEQIRVGARDFARRHLSDSFFVAGATLYWSEGAKTMNRLAMSHSEPEALRLFIAWVGSYLLSGPRGAIRLNLHADNDLEVAEAWWLEQLAWAGCRVNNAFIKPDGTGHRRNHLPYGVCAATIDRSTDAFHRTMAFVDVLREDSNTAWAKLAPGR